MAGRDVVLFRISMRDLKAARSFRDKCKQPWESECSGRQKLSSSPGEQSPVSRRSVRDRFPAAARYKAYPRDAGCCLKGVPIGSIVVPFWGSYLGSYKVIPKRNYFGAYG